MCMWAAVDVECFRSVCLIVCVNLGPKACHKHRRAKSLRLAVAYISYPLDDKILWQIIAYKVCSGSWGF